MNTQKDPSKALRLRAEMIRLSLTDLCRSENRSVASAIRVASHLVHDEDVEGKPPQNNTPAIKQAMEYHRCLHKAEEPDYPETSKRQFLENEEKNKKFMADFRAKAKKKQ